MRDRQPASCPRRRRPGSRTSRNSWRKSRNCAGDRLAEDERRGPRRSGPTSWRSSGDVVRVLHEPDVEDEVGLERDAVLEAEADQLDRELVRLGRRARAARRSARAARAATGPTCRRRRRPRARIGSSRRRSAAIELRDPALVAERMAVARLGEPPDEDLVARLEEEDPRPDPAALERAAHRRERQRRVAGPHVEHDRDPGEPLAVRRRPAPRGPAAARPAGCRRRCSRGPRTASRRRSCRRPRGRSG